MNLFDVFDTCGDSKYNPNVLRENKNGANAWRNIGFLVSPPVSIVFMSFFSTKSFIPERYSVKYL